LSIFLEEKDLGLVISENFPVQLDQKNWREPDIAYISKDRSKFLEKTIFQGIPNFIIEIISDDSRYRDEVRKRAEYERLGVEEYWIIDPDSFKESTFLRLTDRKYEEISFKGEKLESIAVPKFFILKKWIWVDKNPPKLLDACRMLELL
jgi:Uma2 family endonuclease